MYEGRVSVASWDHQGYVKFVAGVQTMVFKVHINNYTFIKNNICQIYNSLAV
jgi:hypothetical protein